jgi:hypothetical protein
VAKFQSNSLLVRGIGLSWASAILKRYQSSRVELACNRWGRYLARRMREEDKRESSGILGEGIPSKIPEAGQGPSGEALMLRRRSEAI